MSSIFNYQNFEVRLEKNTRTLWILFKSNYFTTEMLFELESMLAWCTGKVEIHSIVFQSRQDKLSQGIDPNILKNLTLEKLETFTKKIQKINTSLMHLPQIIIADLGFGCHNIASEFATACDIRVAHRSCKMSFDHTQRGLMPSAGGISQLSLIAGHANAKNWLLTGADIGLDQLTRSGYVFTAYTSAERYNVIEKILQDIHSQAPVSRIQTKMGIVEHVREPILQLNKLESKLAKAAMISEDWKNDLKSMPAKHMKEAVKLTLIKNDEPIS